MSTPRAIALQVWQSRDRRESRHVRVERVDQAFAYVVQCGVDGRVHGRPRRSRIRLADDGTVSRYRLVKDAPPQ